MKFTRYPELPSLELVDTKNNIWELRENWISQLVNGKAVLIRKGLQTDGASIPRAFWRVIGHPFIGWLLPHAIAHDALYAGELCTRAEADKYLLESMILAGVAWWKRNAVWSAVRAGGWLVWARHKTDDVIATRKQCEMIDTAVLSMLLAAPHNSKPPTQH